MSNISIRIIFVIIFIFFINIFLSKELSNKGTFYKNTISLLNKSKDFSLKNIKVERIDNFTLEDININNISIWDSLNLSIDANELKCRFDKYGLLTSNNPSFAFVDFLGKIFVKYKNKDYSFESFKILSSYINNKTIIDECSFTIDNMHVMIQGEIFKTKKIKKKKKEITRNKQIEIIDKIVHYYNKVNSFISPQNIKIKCDFNIFDDSLKSLNIEVSAINFFYHNLYIKSLTFKAIFKDNKLVLLPNINISVEDQKRNISISLDRDFDNTFSGNFQIDTKISDLLQIPHLNKNNYINKNINIATGRLNASGSIKKLSLDYLINNDIKKLFNNLTIYDSYVSCNNFNVNNLLINRIFFNLDYNNQTINLRNGFFNADELNGNINCSIDFKQEQYTFNIKKLEGNISNLTNFIPSKKIRSSTDKIFDSFSWETTYFNSFSGDINYNKIQGFSIKGNLIFNQVFYKGIFADQLNANIFIDENNVLLDNFKVINKDIISKGKLHFFYSKGKTLPEGWFLDINFQECHLPLKDIIAIIDEDLVEKFDTINPNKNLFKFNGLIPLDKKNSSSLAVEGELFFQEVFLWNLFSIYNLKGGINISDKKLLLDINSNDVNGNIQSDISFDFQTSLLDFKTKFDKFKLSVIPTIKDKVDKGKLSGNINLQFNTKTNTRKGDALLKITEAFWEIPVLSSILYPLKGLLTSITEAKIPLKITNDKILVENAKTNGGMVSIGVDGFINDKKEQIELDIDVYLFRNIWPLRILLSPISLLFDSKITGTWGNYQHHTKSWLFFKDVFHYNKQNRKLDL